MHHCIEPALTQVESMELLANSHSYLYYQIPILKDSTHCTLKIHPKNQVSKKEAIYIDSPGKTP